MQGRLHSLQQQMSQIPPNQWGPPSTAGAPPMMMGPPPPHGAMGPNSGPPTSVAVSFFKGPYQIYCLSFHIHFFEMLCIRKKVDTLRA